MMPPILILLLSLFTFHSAYGYKNPVVNSTKPGWGLSGFEYDGTYYLLNTFYLNVNARTSTDFQNWSEPQSILNLYDGPSWLTTPSTVDLVVVNGTFLIYFGSTNYCIGVASSKNLTGPYTFRKDPLICGNDLGAGAMANYPSVLNDGGKLYLYYFKLLNRVHTIGARALSDDGLSFANEEEFDVITADSSEADIIYSPRVIRRGKYYYMIYTNLYCSGLLPARADSPLGDFTKMGEPIVTGDRTFGNLHFPIVLRNKNDTDVLLYACDDGSFRCLNEHTYVVARNIIWEENDWPSLEERKHRKL